MVILIFVKVSAVKEMTNALVSVAAASQMTVVYSALL